MHTTPGCCHGNTLRQQWLRWQHFAFPAGQPEKFGNQPKSIKKPSLKNPFPTSRKNSVRGTKLAISGFPKSLVQ
jgi:hypothetical protein